MTRLTPTGTSVLAFDICPVLIPERPIPEPSTSLLPFALCLLTLRRPARCRIPFGVVGLFLEVRARHELLREVGRVVNNGRHHEPFARLRIRHLAEVLGDLRVLAVGHA